MNWIVARIPVGAPLLWPELLE
uniref:Uncharacterized protein n=1 Tax=Anguilla anguilla TaxID=7936 RepID=A0A0E9R2D7_ANGAN